MKRKKLYKRDWLNDKGTAFVELSFGGDEEDRDWGEIKFADCSRIIALDFNFRDSTRKAQALKKLDKILKAVTEAKNFVQGDDATSV